MQEQHYTRFVGRGQTLTAMKRYAWLLLFVLSACAERQEPVREHGVRVDGTLEFVDTTGAVIHAINIEIAETEATRSRGLMDRRSLSAREGMLFIFERPDDLSFWMRNTAIPLDIIFVDANRQIVNIAQRTMPLSDAYIQSTAPAQYVVEVRGGVTERFGITSDAAVRWQRTTE